MHLEKLWDHEYILRALIHKPMDLINYFNGIVFSWEISRALLRIFDHDVIADPMKLLFTFRDGSEGFPLESPWLHVSWKAEMTVRRTKQVYFGWEWRLSMPQQPISSIKSESDVNH